MGDLSKNFSLHEFACHCGCGLAAPSPLLIDRLQKSADIAGIPFVVTSGHRCEKHNAAVGGKALSSHLTGDGVDISAGTGSQRYAIVRAALLAGITRIGVHKHFIHLDVARSFNHPPEVLWLY